MAIAFARARFISRSTGGNAIRSAAYNGRASLRVEGTGQVFHFRHRDGLEHHEVLLPEDADPMLADSTALWNAAEAAEKRKDAQVVRELVLALPANRELTHEDRVELARTFAEQHFVSKGVAVQLDIHAPHTEAGEAAEAGERTNWHAHLLITTRRVEGTGLAARKAVDLAPQVRSVGKVRVVSEGDAWGEAWRRHQDAYFITHGIGVRVDATAAMPGEHVGPVRMRAATSEAATRAEDLRAANEVAARDPALVTTALTRTSATFTVRDLDRYLEKHLPAGERDGARALVLEHPELLALHDRSTGEAVGRYTTRAVREQERGALAGGAAVARAGHHRSVPGDIVAAVAVERTLRDEQREAVEFATAASGLAVIEGRAGTGKSYVLGAVREAYEQAGHRVVGLAPTNAVAQDLQGEGFTKAATVHSALFALKNDRGAAWDVRTVVMVDEAAMLDSRVTGELLAAARASGAKVVLAGDDRQLASVERGGLFTELRQRHGSAVIRQVTRQGGWQREAAEDLAEGRFVQAVRAFDRHGAVTWTADQDEAEATLVARVRADSAADPQAGRFVFAYTNAEVDRLNSALRQARWDRGELGGADVVLATKHGAAGFAVGDRVQFTDTAKRLGLHNGSVGTITGLDATGQVTARLDGKEGRVVTWSASEFAGFRHGYAGTIYKGQGRTLDDTYLLHSHHWRAAASYVALTRQRRSARVFVARETARDAGELARQMGRGEVRAASVAWATAAELAASPRRLAAAAVARSEAVREGALLPAGAQPGEDGPEGLRRVLHQRRTVLALHASLASRGPQFAAGVVVAGLAQVAAEVAARVQEAVRRLAPQQEPAATPVVAAPTPGRRGMFDGLKLGKGTGATPPLPSRAAGEQAATERAGAERQVGQGESGAQRGSALGRILGALQDRPGEAAPPMMEFDAFAERLAAFEADKAASKASGAAGAERQAAAPAEGGAQPSGVLGRILKVLQDRPGEATPPTMGEGFAERFAAFEAATKAAAIREAAAQAEREREARAAPRSSGPSMG